MEETDKEINNLMEITSTIITMLGSATSTKINEDISANTVDLDLSDEIAGILMTVFTCLRKEENDIQGYYLKYKEDYVVKANGVEIGIQAIVDTIKARKIEINFLIATPIVEIITLFNGFFNEVRTGMSRFKVLANVAQRGIKRDAEGNATSWDPKGKELIQNISQYGLALRHVPLLQGITLAPKHRTEVVRCLGPLTQAILLVMEDKYRRDTNMEDKLGSALSNSLQMLPMASEVVKCLKEAHSPGSVEGILRELGDILLMTTPRSTQKCYFPLMLLYFMWQKKTDDLRWSFSGSDMIKAYTLLVSQGLQFRIKTGGDMMKTSQAVFHAMFGTYLNDLDILSGITTYSGKWSQRKEMNSVFLKQNAMLIKPIAFKYVSKMAQSLLTNSLRNINSVSQSIGRPSFAGFRKRVFSQEFLAYLKGRKSAPIFSEDPIQLFHALRKTKDQVFEDKDNVKLLHAGTTSWETLTNGKWVTCDPVDVEGTSKFFGI